MQLNVHYKSNLFIYVSKVADFLTELYVVFVIDDRWDFVGNTIVTNNYVRLTSDQQSQKGAIWNIVV